MPPVSTVSFPQKRPETNRLRQLMEFAFFSDVFAVASRLFETIGTENTSVASGLKGHNGFTAAAAAYRSKILTLCPTLCLTGIPAFLAAQRLVFEPLLRVELLLARREHELLAAVLAHQSLVFVHDKYPSELFSRRDRDGFMQSPFR